LFAPLAANNADSPSLDSRSTLDLGRAGTVPSPYRFRASEFPTSLLLFFFIITIIIFWFFNKESFLGFGFVVFLPLGGLPTQG